MLSSQLPLIPRLDPVCWNMLPLISRFYDTMFPNYTAYICIMYNLAVCLCGRWSNPTIICAVIMVDDIHTGKDNGFQRQWLLWKQTKTMASVVTSLATTLFTFTCSWHHFSAISSQPCGSWQFLLARVMHGYQVKLNFSLC